VIRWEQEPSCEGCYNEGIAGDFPIHIAIMAQNWSNKEQRRLPIGESTRWGLWVGGGVVSLEIESLEAARTRGLSEAAQRLRVNIDHLSSVLAEIENAKPPRPSNDESRIDVVSDHAASNSRNAISSEKGVKP
jgi:hypothetical protein